MPNVTLTITLDNADQYSLLIALLSDAEEAAIENNDGTPAAETEARDVSRLVGLVMAGDLA